AARRSHGRERQLDAFPNLQEVGASPRALSFRWQNAPLLQWRRVSLMTSPGLSKFAECRRQAEERRQELGRIAIRAGVALTGISGAFEPVTHIWEQRVSHPIGLAAADLVIRVAP